MMHTAGGELTAGMTQDHLQGDEVAIAANVAVSDLAGHTQALTRAHWMMEFPFLARVQVAEWVLQSPAAEQAAHAAKDQGWGDRPSEGGVARIPRMPVSDPVDILLNQLGGGDKGLHPEVFPSIDLVRHAMAP